jgi:hypothetical protein
MEEIFEGVARIVGGFLRWVLWELFFQVNFVNIARVFLLAMTLGRYPRGELSQVQYDRVAVVGLLVVLGGLGAVALDDRYG